MFTINKQRPRRKRQKFEKFKSFRYRIIHDSFPWITANFRIQSKQKQSLHNDIVSWPILPFVPRLWVKWLLYQSVQYAEWKIRFSTLMGTIKKPIMLLDFLDNSRHTSNLSSRNLIVFGHLSPGFRFSQTKQFSMHRVTLRQNETFSDASRVTLWLNEAMLLIHSFKASNFRLFFSTLGLDYWSES